MNTPGTWGCSLELKNLLSMYGALDLVLGTETMITVSFILFLCVVT